MPYRIAAPPEPEPPEPEHPYVEVLRKTQRNVRLLAVAAGAAALTFVVSALAKPASHDAPSRTVERMIADERARLENAQDAVATARARARDEQLRFQAVMLDAITNKVEPRPELGACPVTLPRAASIARRSAFTLLLVEPGEVAALPSPAVADLLADIGRAEAHVASGRFEEASLYARALAQPDRLRSDVVLVASTWKKPRMLSPTSYEPGLVEGRAYLYDFASHAVICAADVRATSSPSVGFAYAPTAEAPPALGRTARLTESVDEDLRAAIERAVADQMKYRAGR